MAARAAVHSAAERTSRGTCSRRRLYTRGSERPRHRAPPAARNAARTSRVMPSCNRCSCAREHARRYTRAGMAARDCARHLQRGAPHSKHLHCRSSCPSLPQLATPHLVEHTRQKPRGVARPRPEVRGHSQPWPGARPRLRRRRRARSLHPTKHDPAGSAPCRAIVCWCWPRACRLARREARKVRRRHRHSLHSLL